MELRQLRFFEAVARCGGFSRAAEQLHIAQPAVSAQVRRLERELGATLLERTTRRVTLTHAGELFLSHARAVLVELDAARADLDDLEGVLRGHLDIGVTHVLGSLDLPGSLAAFHRRYRELSLAVRSGLIAELLRELDAGTVNVVLGPIHDDLPDRYLARPLVTEKLVLITPPDRPVERTKTTLAAFRDEPFVCLPVGSGLRAILTVAAADLGLTPRIQFEAADPVSIRELVSAGLGVALLAESTALADGPAIGVQRLEPAPKHPPIGLIRVRERTVDPAVRAWQQHLEQFHRGGLHKSRSPSGIQLREQRTRSRN